MSSALLVMDVQQAIVDIVDDGSGYVPRVRSAIDAARAAGAQAAAIARSAGSAVQLVAKEGTRKARTPPKPRRARAER